MASRKLSASEVLALLHPSDEDIFVEFKRAVMRSLTTARMMTSLVMVAMALVGRK